MKENFSKSLQKALQFLLPLQRNILELGLGESIEILYSIFKIERLLIEGKKNNKLFKKTWLKTGPPVELFAVREFRFDIVLWNNHSTVVLHWMFNI